MRKTVTIPDELWRQAKARAALDGVPVSDVLQNALHAFLDSPTREPLVPTIKKGRTMTVVMEPIPADPTAEPIDVKTFDPPRANINTRPEVNDPETLAGFNSRPFTPVPKTGKKR